MKNNIKTFIKEKKIIAKLLIILSLVVIDLITKVFSSTYFATNDMPVSILWGLISFTFVKNTGAAFGSFSSSTIFLTIISFVFVVVFVVVDIYQKRQTRLYTYGYTLIVAGAVGNLVDRLFLGYVRDFIKFSMFDFVCNIADVCICIGVFLYVLDLVLSSFKDKKETKNDER